MSNAVARRARALERERADRGRLRGAAQKKSSRALKLADHGLDGKEEQAARSLAAILEARATGEAIVEPEERDDDRGARALVELPETTQRRRGGSTSPSKGKSKESPLERLLAEMREADGGGDEDLPPWFAPRWAAAIAAARSADSSLTRSYGRRPDLHELRHDEAAGTALTQIEKLRALRTLLLQGDGSAGGGDASQDLYADAIMQASSSAVEHAADSDGVGLFRGYSRELLRLRQLLTRAGKETAATTWRDERAGARAGVARVALMLSALTQRARADAALLPPPPLLPGVTISATDVELDPEHARYLWLCERPERMSILAGTANAIGSLLEQLAGDSVGGASDEQMVSNALARRAELATALVAEERHERLCEAGSWERLLGDWHQQKLDAAGHSPASPASHQVGGRAAPPPLRLHPVSPPVRPSSRPGVGAGSFAAKRSPGGGASERGHGRTERSARTERSLLGGMSARLFVRGGMDFPWVEQIAKDYGLEWEVSVRHGHVHVHVHGHVHVHEWEASSGR